MLYTQLRSFHAVATEGGFTAASRVLSIGQPTITTQVRALEEHYDVELFHRRGRSVTLTEAGRGLFSITQRMMSQEADAQDYLNALGGFHTGHLKIGAAGPFHVTEMLSAFSERYPDLKLSVIIGNSQEVLNRLLDFRADVAVLVPLDGGVLQDERFWTLPYSRDEIHAFMNKNHPLAKKRSIKLTDLAGERMILRERGSSTRRVFEAALAEADVSIDPMIEIGSREAVWMTVQRGLGIGVVSQSEYIPHKNLKAVPFSDCKIYTSDHLVCLTERKDSRMIRAFLDVALALKEISHSNGLSRQLSP